ncbi:hypothetical protein RG620_001979 [Acinetobacter baumannii]|nr:hypothetical protein [Acinetobacter baumannii]
MTTLQELCINRKNQLQNRNGTEALRKRIAILKTLTGEEHRIFAEKIKGYIEGLFDSQVMTFQDAKDWEAIVESNLQGRH